MCWMWPSHQYRFICAQNAVNTYVYCRVRMHSVVRASLIFIRSSAIMHTLSLVCLCVYVRILDHVNTDGYPLTETQLPYHASIGHLQYRSFVIVSHGTKWWAEYIPGNNIWSGSSPTERDAWFKGLFANCTLHKHGCSKLTTRSWLDLEYY